MCEKSLVINKIVCKLHTFSLHKHIYKKKIVWYNLIVSGYNVLVDYIYLEPCGLRLFLDEQTVLPVLAPRAALKSNPKVAF